MDIWTFLWILWGIFFAIVETVAVINDKNGDTLSEHFRKWFRTDTNIGRTIFLVAFGIFAVWFGIHIPTGTY